jgi:hypothetical protein
MAGAVGGVTGQIVERSDPITVQLRQAGHGRRDRAAGQDERAIEHLPRMLQLEHGGVRLAVAARRSDRHRDEAPQRAGPERHDELLGLFELEEDVITRAQAARPQPGQDSPTAVEERGIRQDGFRSVGAQADDAVLGMETGRPLQHLGQHGRSSRDRPQRPSLTERSGTEPGGRAERWLVDGRHGDRGGCGGRRRLGHTTGRQWLETLVHDHRRGLDVGRGLPPLLPSADERRIDDGESPQRLLVDLAQLRQGQMREGHAMVQGRARR